MKKLLSKNTLLLSLILLMSNISYGQTRESKSVNIHPLQFTHSLVSVEKDSATHLVVELDRKLVRKVEKVFVTIGTSEHRGDVLAKALDVEILKGHKTTEKIKANKFDKDQIKLDLGPIDPGTYHIGLRIMDDKKDMYTSSKEINL